MHSPLLMLAAAGGLLARSASASPPSEFPAASPPRPPPFSGAGAKNFVYIVPDGYGAASQTMARDFVSLMQNGEDPTNHVSIQLPADELMIGSVQTFSDDNMITDSAAAVTAFACGVKAKNGVIGIDEDGQVAGSILEAAHLAGLKTGLVSTSRITHATPAGYASHSEDRDLEGPIAEQEIGYSHPLGSVVDVLLGGGRCYFTPQQTEGSCRTDDIDLFGWAEEKGWNVITNRAGFDGLQKGSKAELPYIGLFNDDHMQYEVDRDARKEPSLLEMTETALNSLNKATLSKPQDAGYFLMIEASRIDHAGHSHDAAAHLHDILQYNEVMDFVRNWIDNNPDTIMLSAADHETGGLTLNGYNPVPLKSVTNSTEDLDPLFAEYEGNDAAGFLQDTILPAYGITDASKEEIESLVALKGQGDFATRLGDILSDRAGVNWSTGGHTATDVLLHGYGWKQKGQDLKRDMAGNWNNIQLPRYIEKALNLDMNKATEELKKDGVDWVPQANLAKRSMDYHAHHH